MLSTQRFRLHRRMSALYPFSMQPAFDPRPWGTIDLSPIYPNHKFEEKIGEAWLTGDACKVANGPLKGQDACRIEFAIRTVNLWARRRRIRIAFPCF